MIKLIINADDFGLTSSVNKAIIDVFLQGNLNSTTMMVNMPGTMEAVELSRVHKDLAIGLHFCLTEGKAVHGPSSLTREDGSFFRRSELIRRIQLKKIKKDDIRSEFLAQLNRLKSFGIHPTHADSHQHLHMMPAIFNSILPVLQSTKLPVRIVRPKLNPRLFFRRPMKLLKQLVLWFNAGRLFRSANVPVNSLLVSIHDLETFRSADPSVYPELLSDLPEDSVVELMVHPYILNDDVTDMYRHIYGEYEEFLRKCGEEYRILTTRNNLFQGFDLISYASIR